MMGESVSVMDTETNNKNNNASFWLPSHFLTDDDFLFTDPKTTKPTFHNNTTTSNKMMMMMGGKCGSSDVFNSGFGSDPFLDTTTTPDSADENDPEDFLLSDLTRHLARSSLNHLPTTNDQKAWKMSTSPQSTLTGLGPWSNRSGFTSNGSPNGPSPPLTPELKNDTAWDLLYEAAGQVARLKMNAFAAQFNRYSTDRGLLAPPRQHNHLNTQYEQVKWAQQEREINNNSDANTWYCPHHRQYHQENLHQRRSCGGSLGLPTSAWPALAHRQTQTHQMRQESCTNGGGVQMRNGMYYGGGARGNTALGPIGGGGVKRQSTGTGVFLPRRVSTTPPRQHYQPEPRKKSSGCTTVVVPARVVQTLNLDLEDNNLNSHSRFTSGFPSDHDLMVARRNAILAQQRMHNTMRNESSGGGATTKVGHGHEILLPSDWTY